MVEAARLVRASSRAELRANAVRTRHRGSARRSHRDSPRRKRGDRSRSHSTSTECVRPMCPSNGKYLILCATRNARLVDLASSTGDVSRSEGWKLRRHRPAAFPDTQRTRARSRARRPDLAAPSLCDDARVSRREPRAGGVARAGCAICADGFGCGPRSTSRSLAPSKRRARPASGAVNDLVVAVAVTARSRGVNGNGLVCSAAPAEPWSSRVAGGSKAPIPPCSAGAPRRGGGIMPAGRMLPQPRCAGPRVAARRWWRGRTVVDVGRRGFRGGCAATSWGRRGGIRAAVRAVPPRGPDGHGPIHARVVE